MRIFDIVVLALHVLGATVWTGGHLVLSISVLPRALGQRAPDALLQFESNFERVGLPALALQAVTGIWLLYRMLPVEGPAAIHVAGLAISKLVLLALTVALAAHARLRLIPRLGPENLRLLGYHIIAVTFLSVLLVVAGVGFRVGPRG